MLLFLPEDLIVEGFVAQKAQFEYQLDGFLKLSFPYLLDLLSFARFYQILVLYMIEGKKY